MAEENGFIAHILNLIAHMQKDSIVGRACRLLGNLATNQNIAVKLHQKGAVPKLIESIKCKDNSPGTKHMAVRALRFAKKMSIIFLSLKKNIKEYKILNF